MAAKPGPTPEELERRALAAGSLAEAQAIAQQADQLRRRTGSGGERLRGMLSPIFRN
ncbi:hypothetical protein LK533_06245 [Sphingomonas sp. PL-96]|uniref:hypothetical protein n=1 Tax=Sphingomonas sp. PL-96 TaxID=2887201 RepID=UPI001E58BFFC|nr:hypothetical protein [Sphingomonas sp. PL-96]MCC2976274.1 hypothetical protein [Sphingomonas sp. PL-96]